MVINNKVIKNNLEVLISWVAINTIVIIIAILKGMEQSIMPLLAFLGGQLIALIFSKNIKEKAFN